MEQTHNLEALEQAHCCNYVIRLMFQKKKMVKKCIQPKLNHNIDLFKTIDIKYITVLVQIFMYSHRKI